MTALAQTTVPAGSTTFQPPRDSDRVPENRRATDKTASTKAEEDSRDTGRRRRKSDPVDEFALLRDRILLAIGGAIVLVIAAAAIFVDIRNPEVALAALTVGAGLLGAPTIIRLDEVRQRKRNRS